MPHSMLSVGCASSSSDTKIKGTVKSVERDDENGGLCDSVYLQHRALEERGSCEGSCGGKGILDQCLIV